MNTSRTIHSGYLTCINVLGILKYRRVLLSVCQQSYRYNHKKNHVTKVQSVELLVPKMCHWLGCTQEKAKEICVHLPQQKVIKYESVEECINYLNHNGIDSSMLLDNPWLLFLPLYIIKERVYLLTKIGITVDTVPLLKLTGYQLSKVVDQWLKDQQVNAGKWKFDSRLQYLAEKLQCSMFQVATQMEHHYPLLTQEFEKIERVMNLLLDNGIEPEVIRKDLWIFRHNQERMIKRIELARAAGVDPIMPWILRSPEFYFLQMLEKCRTDREILGEHKDVVSYLSERLRCSETEVLALNKKFPGMISINLPKLKSILDFLYQNGFTPQQVKDLPRVLGYSLKSTKMRLQELSELGYRVAYLSTLILTAKQYKHLITKLRDKKKRNEQI